MKDYTIFYKRELPVTGLWSGDEKWDLLISAYTPAERTQRVFDAADATHKWWLLFPEYGYSPAAHPAGSVFHHESENEAHFVSEFWKVLPPGAAASRICVDITGFIRPYLIFLVRWFLEKGIKRFDAIYSEPVQYQKRELTEFSGDIVGEVRQVAGCEGIHVPDVSKDVVIIGAGYEDNLISHVSEDKSKATKLELIGFPSLRADMYQENVLQVQRAEEALGASVDDETRSFFAPANDPFVAATELSKIVTDWETRKGITNLYVCPLSTKAHVLGFALFYVTERRGSPTSVIFPFEERYSQNTSTGVARIWRYSVELPPS